MPNKELLFEIKPKYNPAYITITHFWDIVVFIFILIVLGLQPGMFKNVIVVGILALIMFMAVLTLRVRRSKKYYYKFLNDRIIYRDTYFGNKVKEIKYNEIKEIRYYQGYIQTKLNIGEIYIITNNRNIFKNVITFKSIPNTKKNYERIVSLFNT